MRVLIAGETWTTHTIEIKGFSTFTTSAYAVGLTELVEALTSDGHDVEHVANHEAIERFPWSLEEFQAYDVVVMSDSASASVETRGTQTSFPRGERLAEMKRMLIDPRRG
jgi:uncharacterized membrane protein